MVDGIKRIFEDEAIIVCIKPNGVASEDGKASGMPTMLSKGCGNKPFVVHRLDKEVGGLMVFAKTKVAAADLSVQMQSGLFSKEYLAVVEGEIETTSRYEDLLFHDRGRNKTYVVKRERKGVKDASLGFTREGLAFYNGEKLSLVRIKLETGRTHQIRTQFAFRKHPVFGDRKYGSHGVGQFALFSAHLSFKHPLSGEQLSFSEKPEDAFPWSIFNEQILKDIR